MMRRRNTPISPVAGSCGGQLADSRHISCIRRAMPNGYDGTRKWTG